MKVARSQEVSTQFKSSQQDWERCRVQTELSSPWTFDGDEAVIQRVLSSFTKCLQKVWNSLKVVSFLIGQSFTLEDYINHQRCCHLLCIKSAVDDPIKEYLIGGDKEISVIKLSLVSENTLDLNICYFSLECYPPPPDSFFCKTSNGLYMHLYFLV